MTLFMFPPPRVSVNLSAVADLRATFIAVDTQGQIVQRDEASLGTLAANWRNTTPLLIVLAACDVTVLRLTVPPLSAPQLEKALPAIVEDHLLTEVEHCVVVAGAEKNSQREIAVAELAWINALLSPFMAAGWRDISAVPLQCCLPRDDDDNVANVAVREQHGAGVELAVRMADGTASGVLISAVEESTPNSVINCITALLPNDRVRLLLPRGWQEPFSSALDGHRASARMRQAEIDINVICSAALKCELNLARQITHATQIPFRWRRWRRALYLLVILFIINTLALAASWFTLRQETDLLRAQLVDIFRQALPSEKVIVDPLAQMRQRAESKNAFGTWAATLEDVDIALKQAAAPLPPTALKSLDYADTGLTLQWPQSSDRPPMSALIKAFHDQGFAVVEPLSDDALHVGGKR